MGYSLKDKTTQWRLYHFSSDKGYSVIEDENGVSIANVWGDDHICKANFIIEACNSYNGEKGS